MTAASARPSARSAELTLQNEIWKKVAEKSGVSIPPQKRPK